MTNALGLILLLIGAGLIIEETSHPWVHVRAGLGILFVLIGIGLVLSTRVLGG